MGDRGESATVSILLQEGMAADERLQHLLPLVYAELRGLAGQLLATERRGHTLQATALVHEAFMRLVGPRELSWENKAHFYGAAAQAMRRVLVDHARARTAGKRGGGQARRAALELTGLPDPASEEESAGFLILDEALERLEDVDPAAASVVRLRYFAGLGVEETAASLGVSAPTVKRTWAFARGWLRESIESQEY